MAWADAVFEGGGAKAIGLVGALSVAEKRGYRFRRFAGTSAGALLAALLAAGYRPEALRKIVMEQDFSEFLEQIWYDSLPYPVPYMGRFLRFWWRKGLHTGEKLEQWLRDLLLAKGIYSFGDLPATTSLSIVASDITRGKLLVLPQDVAEYGSQPAHMSIARAVRMSCSIPFLFDPVRLLHRPTKTISYIVDGGILSNFPIWLFDRNPPRWPTFGFRLISEQKRPVMANHHGPLSMLRAVVLTMVNAHDDRRLRDQELVRTIEVPSLDVRVTDFGLSHHRKESLYLSGVEAAEKFFERWDFSAYMSQRRQQMAPPAELLRC